MKLFGSKTYHAIATQNKVIFKSILCHENKRSHKP